jgi:hypothetical protein
MAGGISQEKAVIGVSLAEEQLTLALTDFKFRWVPFEINLPLLSLKIISEEILALESREI